VNLAVFDIDGTLTRPYPGEDASFLEGLELALGFRDVDSDWNSYPHMTDSGIVSHLCESRWGRLPTTHEMARFREHYSSAFLARAGPNDGEEISGAAAFVASLRKRSDWRVAVATGNCHSMATLKLTRGAVACLDVPMATADDAVSRADLIRVAIGRARKDYAVAEFRHVVSIGDGPWDLRTARELDVPFVAVGNRCGDESAGARMIWDYEDRQSVLRALVGAVSW
jgi:phosphoglycolate phosphatase-like HAD superfamily hydrolase